MISFKRRLLTTSVFTSAFCLRLRKLRHLLIRPRQGAKYCDQRVCLSVCPLAYLKNTGPNFTKFSVHVGVALISSDNSVIRYVLPVLWITSRLPLIGQAVGHMLKVTRWGEGRGEV